MTPGFGPPRPPAPDEAVTAAVHLAAALLSASAVRTRGEGRETPAKAFSRAVAAVPDAPDAEPWVQLVVRAPGGEELVVDGPRLLAAAPGRRHRPGRRGPAATTPRARDTEGAGEDDEAARDAAATAVHEVLRADRTRAVLFTESADTSLWRALAGVDDGFDTGSTVTGVDLRVWTPAHGRVDIAPGAVAECLLAMVLGLPDPADPVEDDGGEEEGGDQGVDGDRGDEGAEPEAADDRDGVGPEAVGAGDAADPAPAVPAAAPDPASGPGATWASRAGRRPSRAPGREDPDGPPPATPLPWDVDVASGRWRHHRLPLGRDAAGNVVWAPPWHPLVCVAGAPRSGKTTGLSVPALAAWPGPALVVSARPDVLEATVAARSRRGEVAVFDPSGVLPQHRTRRFDLLREARTWRGARRLAEHLTASAPRGGMVEADFWMTKAAQLLGPPLFAAAHHDRSMTDVVRWVRRQEADEVRRLLAAVPGGGGEVALDAFEATAQLEDRIRSSIFTTADAALAVYDLDSVIAAIGPGFDDSFLVPDDDEGAPTLYAVAPATEQASVAPLMSLVIARAVRAAVAHHLATGGPARLLVVVDEAGNVGSVPGLAELTTTAAGCGIQLLTIWHGASQITERYGPRDAETVVDHAGLVFLRGGSRASAALLEAISPDVEPGGGLRALRSIPPGHGLFVTDLGEPRLLALMAAWRDPDLAASLQP